MAKPFQHGYHRPNWLQRTCHCLTAEMAKLLQDELWDSDEGDDEGDDEVPVPYLFC